MARQHIEVTEVIMVLQEQEEEEAETGEATTRNNREAEVRTGHPMVTVVIIAVRKAIAGPNVPNGWKCGKSFTNRTHVMSVRNQAIR